MREPVRGVVAQAAQMRAQKAQVARDKQDLRALLSADDNQLFYDLKGVSVALCYFCPNSIVYLSALVTIRIEIGKRC